MTDKRYPRTLEQAFGPHTSQYIEDDDRPSISEVLVIALIILVSAISAIMLVFLA